jgi:hypothetical protein
MQLMLANRLEELLEEVRKIALSQGENLVLVISVLETAQRSLPRLSLAELARMESGQRPVSKTAYLLGRLEGVIIDLEDVAAYLQEELGSGLDHVSSVKLRPLEFRDIEGAIRRVAG